MGTFEQMCVEDAARLLSLCEKRLRFAFCFYSVRNGSIMSLLFVACAHTIAPATISEYDERK